MPYPLDNISVRFAEHIDEFEDVGAQFLRTVLELEWNECALSAETRLSDFTGRAMPMELLPSTLDALCETWDQWVLERVRAVYDLRLSDTNVWLLNIFRQLGDPSRNTSLH